MRGITLIELATAMTLLVVLLTLAAPSFSVWTRNAQVRSVSDALQNGARLAQAEAVRRSRQTVFFLTNSAQCDGATAPAANGAFWALRTVAMVAGEAVETVQCGQLADTAAGVAISGPTAICFNSMGRQVANASPGAGTATCTLPVSGISSYDISHASGDRPLRVLVMLGGQVRLCDPARTLSATAPDGCPS
jgi:type IV fimbrial biogenesis protein FimT